MNRSALIPLAIAGLLTAAIPVAAAPSLEKTSGVARTAAGREIHVERGRLMVPEVRSDPDARLIPVHFVVLKSDVKNPAPPLFFLPGGPGNLATDMADDPAALDAWAPLLEVSDVVFVDPRGTRDRDLVYLWDGPMPLDFFASADTARAHWARMSRAALAAYHERGVDIRGYTNDESIQDLEALRTALGCPRIALMGFSYGTHLALAYLRRYDAHVSRAVLVGTEGPDHTLKLPWSMDVDFDRLALRVAADPAVAEAVPDLRALLDRVDERLAREPMRVTVKGPGGKPLALRVGPFGLHLILRADIGDATDLPVFPRLLYSIDHGDDSVLRWFVRKRAAFLYGVRGMGVMTDASSGGSAERLRRIQAQAASSRFADVVNFPFPEISPLWTDHGPGPDYYRPVVTAVPTLFLSGELDWNAPPYQAEAVRWGFAHATHLVVANAGHEQTFWQNPDAVPVVRDFLAGKDVSGAHLAYRPLRFLPVEGDPGEHTHPSLEPR